jgi:hypothetical protein
MGSYRPLAISRVTNPVCAKNAYSGSIMQANAGEYEAISTDDPRPVIVNGYIWRTCNGVCKHKKGIDRLAPQDERTFTSPKASRRQGG